MIRSITEQPTVQHPIGKKTLYHCSRNYSIQCSTFVKCQLHYKTINSFYRIVTNWQRFLLKFLPIFKSISCFFSNIFSQSYRIPCFSGISIGIEFYWQSMEGQLDPRYWLSLLHPELLSYIQEGSCIVYIFPPFLDCRHQPTDCSISTSSWIGATVAANVPTINWNSIKLSTRPVSLHMCFGEEAAATRTGHCQTGR